MPLILQQCIQKDPIPCCEVPPALGAVKGVDQEAHLGADLLQRGM
jgi:hypothetical protein